MTHSDDQRLILDLPEPTGPLSPAAPGHHLPFGKPHAGERPRHLREYGRILYKRRWLVSALFLAVMAVTAARTLTQTPIYEARAKLLIESDEPNYAGFREVLDPGRDRIDYYQTQYDLLKSRSLALKTADALGLRPKVAADQPQVLEQAPTLLARLTAPLTGRTNAASSSSTERNGPSLPEESRAQRAAINTVLSGLTISPVRMSRIVNLQYRSADPDLATRIVNAHAKSYIQQTMEFNFMSSKEAADWLADRLTEQRKQVETAEAALQAYRESHDALAGDSSSNIVLQRLADLSGQVTRAKMTRLEKEAVYTQLKGIEGDRSRLDTFPAILASAVIQGYQSELARLQRRRVELSRTLLDGHPDMDALRTSIEATEARLLVEIGKVVAGVRSEYLATQAQESSLAAALEDQKREALVLNKQAIQYSVLMREVESAKSVYQVLLQRAGETGVSTDTRISNVRLIDEAERPTAPILPRTQYDLTLGLILALTLAFGAGFFFEYLDNRIKLPEELKTHLRIPSLGMLPLVRDLHDSYPLVTRSAPPNFSESMRTLRTNIMFSSADAKSRSILVTSTGSSEGKTVLASNLAVSLAETGLRVLVIDGDLRKPRLHDVFEIAQEPGLSNLLVGTTKASECVHKTAVPRLWFLAAGRLPPNPAELLGSTRFRDFLHTLRDHFDWVIIDAPPVLAVTDASVIAHTVTGVIFVVGAEMVSRHAASTALDQLEMAQGKLLGGVLNRVDLHRNPYYYSQYYRAEYQEYYTKSTTQG